MTVVIAALAINLLPAEWAIPIWTGLAPNIVFPVPKPNLVEVES